MVLRLVKGGQVKKASELNPGDKASDPKAAKKAIRKAEKKVVRKAAKK